MNKLKESFRQNAFDEEKTLAQVYSRAQKSGIRATESLRSKQHSRINLGWILGSAAVLVLAWMVATSGWLPTTPSTNVIATVSINVNPSFDFLVDENMEVVEIMKVDDDAQAIDVTGLVGLPIGKAVNELIERIEESGYIDLFDLTDDFVVVTKTFEDGTSQIVMDQLELHLREQIQTGSALSRMNVVEMKATQIEKREADGKEIPIGLYILQGMVNLPDGSVQSAKEFFAKQENLDRVKMQTRVRITTPSAEKLRQRIEDACAQLEKEGQDATELRTRLENAGLEEMLRIQSEVQIKLKATEETGNPDSGNPDPGNQDSENPDSGNPDSGNPDSGNSDAPAENGGANPESGSGDSGSGTNGNGNSN